MKEFLIGISGVIVGAILTLIREYFGEWRSRREKARYSAVRLVSYFDRFVSDCHAVVCDHGEPEQDGCFSPTVKVPNFDLEALDVEWKPLKFEIMYEILDFPSHVKDADEMILTVSEYASFPPHYTEYFEERSYQYSLLGLKAHNITKQLRKTYDMPDKKYSEWNPVDKFKKQIETIEKTRKKEADF